MNRAVPPKNDTKSLVAENYSYLGSTPPCGDAHLLPVGGGSERIVGAVGMMVREGQDAVPYAVPREHAVREPVQSASGCHQNPTDLSAG